MSEVTWVMDDVCVCDNCGAHASTKEAIKHHSSCQPGESKRWQKFYEEQDGSDAMDCD